jgi:hypothetical protein
MRGNRVTEGALGTTSRPFSMYVRRDSVWAGEGLITGLGLKAEDVKQTVQEVLILN